MDTWIITVKCETKTLQINQQFKNYDYVFGVTNHRIIAALSSDNIYSFPKTLELEVIIHRNPIKNCKIKLVLKRNIKRHIVKGHDYLKV